MFVHEWLRFVVTFRLRGWDEEAAAVYALARKYIAERKVEEGELPPTVLRTLHEFAAGVWYGKLLARASDRREVLNRLRELTRAEPDFLTPDFARELEHLELTLAPRKGKPGTVEALIDDLTDHWVDDWTGERNDTAYWQLVELGFDAVPALIEHLDDNRLTRAQFRGFNNFWPYTFRVRHLVSEILYGLSDGDFSGLHWDAQGRTIPPGEALKWWGKVRQIGEERWLLEHALPEKDDDRTPANLIIPRVIRAKYPHRLAALYQTVLLKRPALESETLAGAIAASALPRERKVELLAAGAEHRDARRRHAALKALVGVDGAAFAKHFLEALRRIPADVEFGEPDKHSELRIVELVRETDDRKCWDAVADLSRRGSPASRLHFIQTVSWTMLPPVRDKTFPGRRECLRYLLGFLNDTARADEFGDGRPVVRDEVTIRLAVLLGVARHEELDGQHSPRELSLLRTRVRELAERELARSAK